MVEVFVSINNEGKVMSAAYYALDDGFLKHNLLDEFLLQHILERADNPDKWEWSFEHRNVHIDILSRNEWKVEFFVSRSIPVQMWSKHLVMNPDKATFH